MASLTDIKREILKLLYSFDALEKSTLLIFLDHPIVDVVDEKLLTSS
jgi:hypothetical protein